MFAKKRNHDHHHHDQNLHPSQHSRADSSLSTDATHCDTPSTAVGTPLVSPLQMTFDFELSPTSTAEYTPLSPFSPIVEREREPPAARPQTSHGVGGLDRRETGMAFGSFGLQTPMLPPIPRVASTLNSHVSSNTSQNGVQDQESIGNSRARDDGDNVSVKSTKSALKARLSFEHPIDMLPPLSRPTSPGGSRPQTPAGLGNGSTPRMEPSLFPTTVTPALASPGSKHDTPISPPTPSSPAMSRQFIDSRDKPYGPPPQRPVMLQQHHSSPNLFRPQAPAIVRPPLPTSMSSSGNDFIASKAGMQNTSQKTNLSGSTARPSTRASTHPARSNSLVTTIGMPYQTTADSFPLPQHVMTRPKTPGAAAQIGGVSVPTHHTSSSRTANGARPVETKETKKKRRLTLNPMALLHRRQTTQHPEELVQQRQEQAQALQRQRDLVVSGVQKPAPDFDPRIKGRVVHDFSVPRGKRNTFDEIDMAGVMMSSDGRQGSVSSPIAPMVTDFPPRNASLVNRGRLPDRTERRSVHTPLFKEHLEEMPESSNRISSIQAESLENREFLQRVAKHKSTSAESAILPPFARRSQVLDSAQAAYYDDDESKSSSSSDKERNSNLSSGSAVSPVTARSSQQIPPVEVRQSSSPVSPSSSGKPEDSFLPLSDINQNSDAQRPVSSTSGERSQDGDVDIVSELTRVPPPEKKDRFITEVTSRPYSVVMAPPAIYAVSEGSNESSAVSSPAHHDDQQFKVVMRGVSIRQSKSIEGLGIAAEPQSPPLPDRSGSRSPASQVFAEKNAILPTLEKTPEPDRAQSIQFKPGNKQPKLVEKRASAVGHTRKSSNVPRHASNASRFSFQFGGNESAAQERALEDKHRKMGTGQNKQTLPRSSSPGEEDEEDDFDEDAMYDMDEMEMQGQEEPLRQAQVTAQSANYLQQARQMLQQQDSDDESHYGDDLPNVTKEEDLPYPDHPAFRTHSAVFNDYSRPNSMAAAAQGGYWRDSTIDHYMRDSYCPADGSQGQASGYGIPPNSSGESLTVPTDVTNIVVPRSNFYMQPHAEVPSPAQSKYNDAKPSLPPRDSGNSEQNRIVSGMSFGDPSTTGSSTDQQSSTSEGNSTLRERITSGISSASLSEPITSPFYLQADSAKSSPHLVGPYSPPFPIHLTDDEGTGDDSPQREAALVSLEANSRIRADSFSGEDANLASPSRTAQPMRAIKPITLASPPKRLGGHPRSIPANAIDLSSPSSGQLPQHQREKSPAEVTLTSPTQRKRAEVMAAVQDVGSPPTQVDQQMTVPTGEAIHAAGQKSNGRLHNQDESAEQRSPRISPPTASTALGVNVFGGFRFDESNDFAGPLPDLSEKTYHSREVLHGGNNVSAATSTMLLGHAKSASFQQPTISFQSDHQRFLSLGAGKNEDSLSNIANLIPSSGSATNAAAKSDSNIIQDAMFPKDTSPAQILGSTSLSVPLVAAPTSDPHTLSNHAHNHAPMKGLPTHSGSLSPNSQHAGLGVAYAEGVKVNAAPTENADEMYFDDGNFDNDLNGVEGGTIDESAFDDDSFLSRPGLTNRYIHTRDLSKLSALSSGSDGPYPTFAIPNAHVQRVSQRYSQMMLEDLPLQAGPVDPKYIPQRNPSEDAKRLGVSSRVPPVPVPETDRAAFTRMQQNLQSYHCALADAANRAAAEGRFLRAPSVSTQYSTDLKPDDARGISDARSIADDRSQYSNGEEGGEIHMPYSKHGSILNRMESNVSHLTHVTTYSPPKMSFDFGFDQAPTDDIIDDDSFGNDDDLVAAANAEVLASDVEGFYGQEFDFYGRPRSNSGGDLEAVHGGYFGPDGDDGIMRNKSVKEPSLTPITERSEFSTRSSFVGLNTGPFGPPSAALYGPMSPAIARMPHSPMIDGSAPQSLDELRRLRGQAFGGGGGSNSSYRSNSNRSSSQSLQAMSPTVDTRPGPHSSGYFGQIGAGGVPMQFAYSTSSNASRNSSVPNSAHPGNNNNAGFGGFLFHDSPQSAASSNGNTIDHNNNMNGERTEFSTPRKPPGGLNLLTAEPVTAKKVNGANHSHSRSGSGADSVTYVREPDEDGKQRWVLERRKTGEQGQLELIGRELVQGGWI